MPPCDALQKNLNNAFWNLKAELFTEMIADPYVSHRIGLLVNKYLQYKRAQIFEIVVTLINADLQHCKTCQSGNITHVTLSTSFSASFTLTSPEMSLGRSASRMAARVTDFFNL